MVGDLQDDRDDPRLMMPSSRKGRARKSMVARPVPITASFAARLRRAAGDRPVDAALLVKPDGKPWLRLDHSDPFRATVLAAGLDKAITSYSLRHSSIVHQLLAGCPIRVVATLHDTSVAMIEENYSRYIADHSDAVSRRGLLDLDPATPVDNVVPLPRHKG